MPNSFEQKTMGKKVSPFKLRANKICAVHVFYSLQFHNCSATQTNQDCFVNVLFHCLSFCTNKQCFWFDDFQLLEFWSWWSSPFYWWSTRRRSAMTCYLLGRGPTSSTHLRGKWLRHQSPLVPNSEQLIWQKDDGLKERLILCSTPMGL